MVIISDCLSEDGSSILPRIAKFCGKESKRRMGKLLASQQVDTSPATN